MGNCSSYFSQEEIRAAANKIRPILNTMLANPGEAVGEILKGREEVINRYQPIFSQENIGLITEEDYLSFLVFKNNKHWRALQRQGPQQIRDMGLLREALSILIDESRGIKERLEIILPPKGAMVPWFGRATITPILLVAFPDKYGVLNNPSEAGLRKLRLWPDFDKHASFAERYFEANCIFIDLSNELGIDLWTLDAFWWALFLEEWAETSDKGKSGIQNDYYDDEDLPRFGLERYLQEFMRDNWNKIKELSDWEIYEVDGDRVGYEYNTGTVGKIDILAQHKTEPEWLVIELKRNQSNDDTVGQVLRYMGWVSRELADEDEKVQGLIISHKADPSLDFALEHTHGLEIMLYDVQFSLKKKNHDEK